MPTVLKQHSLAFKLKAIALINRRIQQIGEKKKHTGAIAQVAKELKVHDSLLSRWMRSLDLLKAVPKSTLRGNRMRLQKGTRMIGSRAPVFQSLQPQLAPIPFNINKDGKPHSLAENCLPNLFQCQFPREERQLYTLVADKRNRGLSVTRTNLRDWMLSFVRTNHNPNDVKIKRFTASYKWCSAFMKRYGLADRSITTTRTATLSIPSTVPVPTPMTYIPTTTRPMATNLKHTTQKLPVLIPLHQPTVLDPIVTSFIDFMERHITKHNLSLADIYNFDETRVYFDMPRKRTIHHKGSKNVVMKGTKNESNGFTVCLTCAADGSRMVPLVVFKGSRRGYNSKKVAEQLRLNDVEVRACFQDAAYMDQDIMLNEYIPSVFPTNFIKRKLLVLDSLKSHITDQVKSKLQLLGIDVAVVPGGFTSILQPLDVGIIHSFKEKLRDLWARHMTYLSQINQNYRASYLEICKWIALAWRDIQPSIIINSFERALVKNGRINSTPFIKTNQTEQNCDLNCNVSLNQPPTLPSLPNPLIESFSGMTDSPTKCVVPYCSLVLPSEAEYVLHLLADHKFIRKDTTVYGPGPTTVMPFGPPVPTHRIAAAAKKKLLQCNFPQCRYPRTESLQQFRDHLETHVSSNVGMGAVTDIPIIPPRKTKSCIHCPICSYAFTAVEYLMSHVEKDHLGKGQNSRPESDDGSYKVRVFKCGLCEKTTTKGQDLRRHEVSHSDARDFVCDKCGISFKYDSQLRDHDKKRHKE